MKNPKYRKHIAGTRTATYNTYRGMIERCYLETAWNYKYYGGKGLGVCDRWRKSFKNFVDDMGERPEGMTIDRIDPSRGYSPHNCRWANQATQVHNSTASKLTPQAVRRIRSGEDKSRRFYSELYDVSVGCISDVINRKTWKFVK